MSGEESKEDKGSMPPQSEVDVLLPLQVLSSTQGTTNFIPRSASGLVSLPPTYVSPAASSGDSFPQDSEQRTTIDNPSKGGNEYGDSMSQQPASPQLHPFHPMYDSEESDGRWESIRRYIYCIPTCQIVKLLCTTDAPRSHWFPALSWTMHLLQAPRHSIMMHYLGCKGSSSINVSLPLTLLLALDRFELCRQHHHPTAPQRIRTIKSHPQCFRMMRDGNCSWNDSSNNNNSSLHKTLLGSYNGMNPCIDNNCFHWLANICLIPAIRCRLNRGMVQYIQFIVTNNFSTRNLRQLIPTCILHPQHILSSTCLQADTGHHKGNRLNWRQSELNLTARHHNTLRTTIRIHHQDILTPCHQ